ncbi:MAG: YicC family protein [Desulfobacterales bacterium]|nr:YicC family protein [Desulfobacterales bacterium]
MNRPLSMTGFGRGESSGDGRTWVVELRSVNHRFLDVKIRMPWKYAALEERVKRELGRYYGRGHIDLTVSSNGDGGAGVRLEANLPLAREYHNCLKQIHQDLQLTGAPDLAMVLSCRDVIGPAAEVEEDLDRAWSFIGEALNRALKDALAMREKEGRTLKADLLGRLETFAGTVERVELAVPDINRKRQESLKERLDNLLQGVDIDPVRLAQEAAVLVDKSDITEEMVRLRSHMEQFAGMLAAAEPIGRKLDFLIQEFLREINTMVSKIGNAAVAHHIVDLKNELEKMREQIQNLE